MDPQHAKAASDGGGEQQAPPSGAPHGHAPAQQQQAMPQPQYVQQGPYAQPQYVQQPGGYPIRTYGGQQYPYGEPMVLVPASSVVAMPADVVITDNNVIVDDWGCAMFGLLFSVRCCAR